MSSVSPVSEVGHAPAGEAVLPVPLAEVAANDLQQYKLECFMNILSTK